MEEKKLCWQLLETQEFVQCMSENMSSLLGADTMFTTVHFSSFCYGEGRSRCLPSLKLSYLFDILLVFSLLVSVFLRSVFSRKDPSVYPQQKDKNATLPMMALYISTSEPVFTIIGHVLPPLTFFAKTLLFPSLHQVLNSPSQSENQTFEKLHNGLTDHFLTKVGRGLFAKGHQIWAEDPIVSNPHDGDTVQYAPAMLYDHREKPKQELQLIKRNAIILYIIMLNLFCQLLQAQICVNAELTAMRISFCLEFRLFCNRHV